MSERKRQFLERLDARGEAGVREDLELGRYGGDHIGWARLWLGDLEQSRNADAAASQEAAVRSQLAAALDAAESARLQVKVSEEANRIASDANDIAREARDKAQTANVIATLAMIVAIIAVIVSALISIIT